MAKAFKNYDGPRALGDEGLCATRRVSPWIRVATQFEISVVMPGHEGLSGHEEDVFLDPLPPLSSSTSEISVVVSPAREHAQYGLRRDRIGDAEHPGPMMGALAGAFFVETVLVGCRGAFHSPSNGTQVFLPLTADAEMVSWQARPVHARDPFSHNQ